MRGILRSTAWGRVARLGILSAGLSFLAGCATGYAFVQPQVAGNGAYYTSDGPYSGQGYYDYYGTGPYYPGTSGYGYYNGADPYASSFDWDGDWGWNGGYGPWSPFIFNVGISNVWDFPGYWGPWYATGFPMRGCWHRDCDRHRWRDHHHRRHDPVAAQTSPGPGLRPDRPRAGRLPRGPTPPIQLQAQSGELLTHRRPLESAWFAPHAFANAPIRPGNRRIDRPSPAYGPRVPTEPAFANWRPISMPTSTAMPQGFQPASRPAFGGSMPVSRPAPQAVPVRSAPSQRTAATKGQIP